MKKVMVPVDFSVGSEDALQYALQCTCNKTQQLILLHVVDLLAFLFAMLGLGGGMLYVPILSWLSLPVKAVAIPIGWDIATFYRDLSCILSLVRSSPLETTSINSHYGEPATCIRYPLTTTCAASIMTSGSP